MQRKRHACTCAWPAKRTGSGRSSRNEAVVALDLFVFFQAGHQHQAQLQEAGLELAASKVGNTVGNTALAALQVLWCLWVHACIL